MNKLKIGGNLANLADFMVNIGSIRPDGQAPPNLITFRNASKNKAQMNF